MNHKSEIDATLRALGSVEPPAELERRLNARMRAPQSRVSIRMVQALGAGALAACVGVAALILNPPLRDRLFSHQTNTQGSAVAPHVAAPVSAGGFGAASAVHLPAGPVPVQPTPVNQGRGRSRSSRATPLAHAVEPGSGKPSTQQ